MRLACGDHSFPLLDHEHVCDLAVALGFDGIDVGLMGNRSHVRPEVVREDVAGWAGRLDERIRGRGLDIADVFLIPWSDYNVMAPNHPARAERERSTALFLDVLDLTRRLGAPGMTILPPMDFDGHDHSDSLRLAADALAERVALAQEAGVELSIEAHVGSVVQDPRDALRLVEATPGLRITMDHTHFVRQEYALEAVEPLYPFTRHFHARSAKPGRIQTSMSENALEFERIVEDLRGVGYDGYLAIEYVWTEWERCNECDNLSETIMLRDRLRAALTGAGWEPFVSTI